LDSVNSSKPQSFRGLKFFHCQASPPVGLIFCRIIIDSHGLNS
jgi:hypothetical protein